MQRRLLCSIILRSVKKWRSVWRVKTASRRSAENKLGQTFICWRSNAAQSRPNVSTRARTARVSEAETCRNRFANRLLPAGSNRYFFFSGRCFFFLLTRSRPWPAASHVSRKRFAVVCTRRRKSLIAVFSGTPIPTVKRQRVGLLFQRVYCVIDAFWKFYYSIRYLPSSLINSHI